MLHLPFSELPLKSCCAEIAKKSQKSLLGARGKYPKMPPKLGEEPDTGTCWGRVMRGALSV